MRIGDWSSVVCSSVLADQELLGFGGVRLAGGGEAVERLGPHVERVPTHGCFLGGLLVAGHPSVELDQPRLQRGAALLDLGDPDLEVGAQRGDGRGPLVEGGACLGYGTGRQIGRATWTERAGRSGVITAVDVSLRINTY